MDVSNAITVLAGAVLSLIGFWIGRKYRAAMIHQTESGAEKSDFEKFNLEKTVYLELLGIVSEAHKRSLTDETTIATLRRQLDECRSGHKDLKDCLETIERFLLEVEHPDNVKLDATWTDRIRQIRRDIEELRGD